MPRLAVISDIHGNLPALEAVVREIQGDSFDGIACLGDIVGYGASPAECVDLIRKVASVCVAGNHDVEIPRVLKRGCDLPDPDWRKCPYQAGLVHAAKQLDSDAVQWLSELPFHSRIHGGIVAHGSLVEPEAFHYIRDKSTAAPTLNILRSRKTNLGFFGHTHCQNVFSDQTEALDWLDGKIVRIPSRVAAAVTVGSVGQPRGEEARNATWVAWDSDARIIEFRETSYDRTSAALAVLDAGLPIESAMALLTAGDLAKLGLLD